MIKSVFILLILTATIRAQHGHIEHSRHSDTIAVSAIDSAGIDSVFSFVYSHSRLIDFEDCNICKSRAHIISRVIEKYFPAVTVAKAWLIADCKRSSMKKKYRYKPNVYLRFGSSCNSWAYHVAPVIITAVDTVVIDPATQNKPVTLKTWASGLTTEEGSAFLIIKDDMYYIYPQTADKLFEDELVKWNFNNSALRDDKYLRSVEETMNAKHGFYEPWKFNYYMSELLKLIE